MNTICKMSTHYYIEETGRKTLFLCSQGYYLKTLKWDKGFLKLPLVAEFLNDSVIREL